MRAKWWGERFGAALLFAVSATSLADDAPVGNVAEPDGIPVYRARQQRFYQNPFGSQYQRLWNEYRFAEHAARMTPPAGYGFVPPWAYSRAPARNKLPRPAAPTPSETPYPASEAEPTKLTPITTAMELDSPPSQVTSRPATVRDRLRELLPSREPARTTANIERVAKQEEIVHEGSPSGTVVLEEGPRIAVESPALPRQRPGALSAILSGHRSRPSQNCSTGRCVTTMPCETCPTRIVDVAEAAVTHTHNPPLEPIVTILPAEEGQTISASAIHLPEAAPVPVPTRPLVSPGERTVVSHPAANNRVPTKAAKPVAAKQVKTVNEGGGLVIRVVPADGSTQPRPTKPITLQAAPAATASGPATASAKPKNTVLGQKLSEGLGRQTTTVRAKPKKLPEPEPRLDDVATSAPKKENKASIEQVDSGPVILPTEPVRHESAVSTADYVATEESSERQARPRSWLDVHRPPTRRVVVPKNLAAPMPTTTPATISRDVADKYRLGFQK